MDAGQGVRRGCHRGGQHHPGRAGQRGFDRSLRALVLSRLVGQRLGMLAATPAQEDLQTLRELVEAANSPPAAAAWSSPGGGSP
jgi:hypothetical protein